MKIYDYYSPNFNKKKRSVNSVKLIIIHYTGMQSVRESIKRLCNPSYKVSAHYLIKENGKVLRLVQDKHVAWHAGKSCWGKYKNLNRNSIGIELVNKGHKFGYPNFKKKQILNLIKLCKKLIKKFKIKKSNIVGHSDIAPLRKIDPGEKFPWEHLSKKNIGIWHNYRNDFLKKYRKIKIVKKKDIKDSIRNLKAIGYCFTVKKRSSYTKTIQAFQRHFRQEFINGFFDQECLIISKNLAKKL